MSFPLVHPRSSCKTQSLQTLDQKKPQEKQSGSRAIFQLVKSQFLHFDIFWGANSSYLRGAIEVDH